MFYIVTILSFIKTQSVSYILQLQKVKKNFELIGDNGKTMSAMKVFSESLRYLRTQLLKECKQQKIDVDDSDIRWVITVPAIWTDTAKTFMRQATEEVFSLFKCCPDKLDNV